MRDLLERILDTIRGASRRQLASAGLAAALAAVLVITATRTDPEPRAADPVAAPTTAPVTTSVAVTAVDTPPQTSTNTGQSSTSTTPSATTAGPVEAVVRPIEIARVGVSSSPLPPVLAGQEAWIGDSENGDLTVVRGVEVVDVLDVGSPSSSGLVHDGFLWIPHHRSSKVSVVDTTARVLNDVIEVGRGPRTPAEVAGRIWVPADDGTITIVDAVTHRVERTIEVGGRPRRPLLHAGRVWVPDLDGDVVILDPESGSVDGSVSVGGRPTAVVGLDDIVVVANFDGFITLLGATTAETLTTLQTARDPHIAMLDGVVWLTSGVDSAVETIDLQSLARRRIETPAGVGTSSEAVPGGDLVWFADSTTGHVWAIDDGLQVVLDAVIGTAPSRPAVADRLLYLADVAEGMLLVGEF